jgi:hypothetical protein
MPKTTVCVGVDRMNLTVERKDNNCFSEKGITRVSWGNLWAAIMLLLSPDIRKRVVDMRIKNEENDKKIRRKIGNRIEQAIHPSHERSIRYSRFA